MNTIDQIKLICRTYDFYPKRQMGQNFLINPAVVEETIVAAELSTADTVLEIGPGLGILTESLVKAAGRVVSVELDKKFFDFLAIKFIETKNLVLLNQDILRIRNQELGIKNYKVVANIPYNITSYFLRKFLTDELKPSSLVLLVQKEVAQRICAPAGKMSLLSVSVQLYGQPTIVSLVKKDNFWPQPEVDSAILKIAKVISPPEVAEKFKEISETNFFRLVKMGFSAKRKKLANNLAAGLKITPAQVRLALLTAKIDPEIRAQGLAVADWFALAKNLKIHFN